MLALLGLGIEWVVRGEVKGDRGVVHEVVVGGSGKCPGRLDLLLELMLLDLDLGLIT